MSEKTDPTGMEAINESLSGNSGIGEKSSLTDEKTGVSIKDGEVERGSIEDS